MRIIKLLSIVAAIFFLGACEPSKTEGVVSVVDAATNAPIGLSLVTLTVENPDDPDAGFYLCNKSDLTLDYQETTNTAGVTGKICFTLPAVLKVEVVTPDGKTGSTTLSLVEGETTTVTCKVSL